MRNLFIFVVVLLTAACTRDYDTTVVIDSEDCVTSSYSLKEQAKQSVQEMLNKLDPPTRGFARTVASVEVITYGELFGEDARTRTDSIEWNFQVQRRYKPMLVLTNFTNNSGFAVLQPLFEEGDTLGNDWTNPSTLKYIAITDSGSMTSGQLISYGNDYTSEETVTPIELYDEEEDDFCIGNTEAQRLTASLILSYTHKKENYPLYNLPNAEDLIDYSEVDEVAEEQVGPLLQTIWHQDIPFNAYVHTYNDAGDRRPLGCTTIATGQILTFLKNRSLSFYFGVTTSYWTNIENEDFTKYNSYSGLSQAADNTAKMLKRIADGIGVKYNYRGGTFAFPKQVQRYLEDDLGYNIDRQIGGRKAKRLKNIVNSLNDNKPVFMAGLGDLKEGHAWVVDGYMSNEDSTTAKHDYLIHCNFGWEGNNNGWYLIDTITSNLNDDDLLDEGVTEQSMRYNWAFRYLFFE